MADTSNLSKFLTDVADAIRTKKETTEPIPAADFDSEILSIEGGIDTSDATATSNDIIADKTAYVNGEKVTGTLANYGAGLNTGVESITPNVGYDGSFIEFKSPEQDGPFAFATDKVRLMMTPRMSEVANAVGLTGDKLVKGNTVLGIEGTAEAGAAEVQFKLYKTMDEMYADTDVKENDLGLVYGDDSYSWDGTSGITNLMFPKTVILPSAMTGGCYGYGEGSVWLDLNGTITETSANFSIYANSSYNITYTSADGITYTRTDTYPEILELSSSEISVRMYEWSDVCSYFMYISGKSFEGLYTYTLNYTEPYICNFIDTFTYTNNAVSNLSVKEIDTSKIFAILGKSMITYIPRITILVNRQNENDVYIISNDGYNIEYLYDVTNNKYIGSKCKNTPNIIYHINVETETFEEVTASDCTWFKTIGTTYYADSTDYYTFVIYQYNNKFDDGGSNSGFYMLPITGTTAGSSVTVATDVYTKMLIHDTYTIAKTQFNATEADLIAGKVALGKTGEIIGDGSIFNQIDYTQAWKDSNLQFKDATIYTNLEDSSPSVYEHTVAVQHFTEGANGSECIVQVDTVGEELKANNGYYYRLECTNLPDGWLAYTKTPNETTKTNVYRYNLEQQTYTLVATIDISASSMQSNGSYGFWTRYNKTTGLVDMLVFNTTDDKLHYYNFNLDTYTISEISTSTVVSASDNNEHSSIQYGMADFDKQVVYYGYNGIYKLTFAGVKTKILSGTYYSKSYKSTYSHRYMNIVSERYESAPIAIFDTVTESIVSTGKSWFQNSGVIYSLGNRNVVKNTNNIVILDEELNVLTTVDMDLSNLSTYMYVDTDSTGVTSKTNGILISSASFKCIYVDLDTNTVSTPMFMMWGTTRQYGSLIPLSYNINSTALVGVSDSVNQKVTMIRGTINNTSDILVYNHNKRYKLLVKDFNDLLTKGDKYAGTITPNEYNTALDTAQDILSEEVTE